MTQKKSVQSRNPRQSAIQTIRQSQTRVTQLLSQKPAQTRPPLPCPAIA
jgi:hypothetical protein